MARLTLDDGRIIEIDTEDNDLIVDVVVVVRCINKDRVDGMDAVSIGVTEGTPSMTQLGMLTYAKNVCLQDE